MQNLDTFTRQYLEAALWSSVDDDDRPFDDNYTIEDIADSALESAIADCKAFREANADDLAGIEDSQAGHDFWLTRCGHGAGFWDRGLGAVGRRLTDAAHVYGDVYVYVGDDGLIYLG